MQLHARIGELSYILANTASSESGTGSQKYLAEAMQRFCRSIELCDDYVRGYYGLKLVGIQYTIPYALRPELTPKLADYWQAT